MKSLGQFFDETLGKKVDFDGSFGAQCVDLFRQYNQEVFDLPHTGSVEGAKDLYLKYDALNGEKTHYNRIAHKTGTLPQVGDVIIWDASGTNKYGHVAIVLFATGKNVTVAEQDGFKQDGVKVQVRSYDRCLGYLRKKG
ncbi:MAG: CHAP domain-containing protein [Spirochaetaceae bacterium]|jgi:hypothetical protein|nr:CHAP domain-containing protein [Spirochaetaceae bacterium]